MASESGSVRTLRLWQDDNCAQKHSTSCGGPRGGAPIIQLYMYSWDTRMPAGSGKTGSL